MNILLSLLKALENCAFAFNCCLICQKSLATDRFAYLCKHCLELLPWSDRYCAHCGRPLATTSDLLCGPCANGPNVVERLLFPCWYQPPIDELIKGLKFNGKLAWAKLLSLILVRYLTDHLNQIPFNPQVIIPVPLHPVRLRERGYNQTKEIAIAVSRHMQIPIDDNYLIRVENSSPQSITPIKMRKRNLKHAFAVQASFFNRYQRVALLDDVYTTGSTIKACAHALEKSGVKQIQVWCIARTVRHLSA